MSNGSSINTEMSDDEVCQGQRPDEGAHKGDVGSGGSPHDERNSQLTHVTLDFTQKSQVDDFKKTLLDNIPATFVDSRVERYFRVTVLVDSEWRGESIPECRGDEPGEDFEADPDNLKQADDTPPHLSNVQATLR